MFNPDSIQVFEVRDAAAPTLPNIYTRMYLFIGFASHPLHSYRSRMKGPSLMEPLQWVKGQGLNQVPRPSFCFVRDVCVEENPSHHASLH